MEQFATQWKEIISKALVAWAADNGADLDQERALEAMNLETPPDMNMGDLALPLFPFAKLLRKGPPHISAGLAALIEAWAQNPDAATQAGLLGDTANALATGTLTLAAYLSIAWAADGRALWRRLRNS